MAGIFLGANEIKYNATPVGNMRIGGTNICKGYVGSTLVFDNCAQANSNVQLNVDTSGISGTQYSLSGDTTGTIKSGQPSTSYSKFTTNIAATGSYSWSSGPTVNDAPAGTFPSTPGSTTIVTTTITGTLQAPPNSTTAQLNVTNGITGWVEGDSGNVTESPNNGQDQTRSAGQGYSFTVSVSGLNSGWQLDSAITGAGTYSGTHPASPQFFPVNVSLGGEVSLINYRITPGTISYSVTNGTVGNQFTAGSWTTGFQEGTKNDSYSFALSGLVADSANGYSWQGGQANVAYSIGPSGNFDQTATINATVSGIINQSLSAITLYNYNGSCANDACINKGSATTAYYYSGSLSSATLTDSNGNNPTTGFHAISGGSVLNYSPGSSSTASCYSQLYYTAVATGGGYGSCGNPLTDYWYLNTTSFPTLAYVDGNSNGCSPAGTLTINNGIDWVTTDSTGYVTQRGSC